MTYVHRATSDFWALLDKLTKNVQTAPHKNYALLRQNPRHPSLHFKAIRLGNRMLYSVRATRDYRAVAVLKEGELYWNWIGSHANYDKLFR